MDVVFEIFDSSGRKIRLTATRWAHINQEHPEVAPFLGEVEETLRKPLKAVLFQDDQSICSYYKFLKRKRRYLLVIVKYLNAHGFIITAYFARKIT